MAMATPNNHRCHHCSDCSSYQQFVRRSKKRGRSSGNNSSSRSSFRFFAVVVIILGVNVLHRDALCSAAAKPFHRSFFRSRHQDAARGEGGMTLGDLEIMQEKNEVEGISISGGDPRTTLLTGSGSGMFPSNSVASISGAPQTQQQQQKQQQQSNNDDNPNQLRQSLRRIHLDLSGRIMCHVLSPQKPPSTNNGDDDDERRTSSVPLFTIRPREIRPKFHGSSVESSASTNNNNNNRLGRRRCITPHIYLGADYDLDEVWYGVTRWIAKCSWGPSLALLSKEASLIEASLPTSPLWNAANTIHWRMFPLTTSTSSSDDGTSSSSRSKSCYWILDAEGEQSAFDRSDSTLRLRLIRSPSPSQQQSTSLSSSTTTITHNNNNRGATSQQQISMEYDSAKYIDATAASIPTTNTIKRHLHYAPTITMDVQTPLFHPRLELHSKRRWVVQGGGDRHGNYYGGDHYGSQNSSIDRRLEQIKEGYKAGIPQSVSSNLGNNNPPPQRSSLGARFSQWMDNDGWMPRKVTANLMGNLVAVNEVGVTTKSDQSQLKGKRSLLVNSILPPIHTTGIRLRISKRMDWKTLGIFPWSSNSKLNSRHNQPSNTDYSQNGGSIGTMLSEALQSTNIKLELCGLTDVQETCCASVGIHVDPLEWRETFKVVMRQDTVSVLG